MGRNAIVVELATLFREARMAAEAWLFPRQRVRDIAKEPARSEIRSEAGRVQSLRVDIPTAALEPGFQRTERDEVFGGREGAVALCGDPGDTKIRFAAGLLHLACVGALQNG